MSGATSRNKGHAFERKIARMFREAGFPNAQRQLEYQEGKGVDLQNTGRYLVQCKRGKQYAPITKIEEVYSSLDKNNNHIPVLITKADRKEVMAVIPLDHFLEICEQRP